jgi:hypothetical protein
VKQGIVLPRVIINRDNNILFILDVSDLSMGIYKEAAVLRQLLMILFAFYLPIDINNNTPSASVECSQDTILLNIWNIRREHHGFIDLFEL